MGTQTARKLQLVIGYPLTRNFLEIIDNNLLKNCLITCQYIEGAENIFGPNVESLKEKKHARSPTRTKETSPPYPWHPRFLPKSHSICRYNVR